jgi:hypothetical protein
MLSQVIQCKDLESLIEVNNLLLLGGIGINPKNVNSKTRKSKGSCIRIVTNTYNEHVCTVLTDYIYSDDKIILNTEFLNDPTLIVCWMWKQKDRIKERIDIELIQAEFNKLHNIIKIGRQLVNNLELVGLSEIAKKINHCINPIENGIINIYSEVFKNE